MGQENLYSPAVLLLMIMIVIYSAMTGSTETCVEDELASDYTDELTSVVTIASFRKFILNGLL